MTLVRCSGCFATVENPASEFRCASCSRLLRWHPAVQPTLPVQLGLFGEATPVGATSSRRRRAVRTPPHSLDLGGRSQSLARSHQDVLAAVTEIFHDEQAPAAAVGRARALLTGQSTADLREAALGAAWMLATTLREIETTSPGVGVEILQVLALALARNEEQA
jgi:hypothetical protein